MPEPRLRPAARALVVDEHERVLLFRFDLPHQTGVEVWAAPGGGLEADEVVAHGHATGYDGVINDYFLVRTPAFVPRGRFSDEELRAENMHEHRWWGLDEMSAYDGDAVFSPRDLAGLLTDLLRDGPPAEPLRLGL